MPEGSFVWSAEASIDLSSLRPTPIVDRVWIQTRQAAWIESLGGNWTLLPHQDGVLACHRTPGSLQVVFVEAFNVAPLAFELRRTPVLHVVTRPHVRTVDECVLEQTVHHALPVHQLIGNVGWRLDRTTLYAQCLDVGWNIPIPRDAGAFILREQRGDLCLSWDAQRTPNVVEPAHMRFDEEIDAALSAYRRGDPATAMLLSASAMADPRSAFLSMLVAAEAARRADHNTLRILRVAHQRALDRGRVEFGAIGTLLTCNAALEDRARATKLVPALEEILHADPRLTGAADWICTHLQALLFSDNSATIEDASPAERRVMDTPPVSLEAVAQRTRSGSSIAVGSEPGETSSGRRSADTPHSLSRVEIARLDSRRYSAEFAIVDQLSAEDAQERALQAFNDDDDDKAWEMTRVALHKNARIDREDVASMILRLFPKNASDNLAKKALQAVLDGETSATSQSRAAVMLAQLHRSANENTLALSVLDAGMKRHPDDVALRLERAQLLTEHNPSAAIGAWRALLESGALEPWEAHRYRLELAKLLQHAQQDDALLDELRRLHQEDPGNPELTKNLATQLQACGAIDEAIAVRARHACAISQLRGYPSLALVVQAVNGERPLGLQAAIACANVIHLASTISTPATWLHRAMLTLAERYQDPLILEYAIHSARALELPQVEETLQRALQSQAPPEPIAPASKAQSLVPQILELFPRLSEGSLEDELAHIQRSVTIVRGADKRGALLNRRAAILLAQSDAAAAAQAWTGATILLPDDAKTLAGLCVARAIAGDVDAAQSAREHLIELLDSGRGELPTPLALALRSPLTR